MVFYFILLGKTLLFSWQNIVNCYNVFPHEFFPSKIIFVGFFFNIKLVENLAL
jgi:hypothetical protein